MPVTGIAAVSPVHTQIAFCVFVTLIVWMTSIEQDERDGATLFCQTVSIDPPHSRTLSHWTLDDTETPDSFRMMKSIVSSKDGPLAYKPTERAVRPNNTAMLNHRKAERSFRIPFILIPEPNPDLNGSLVTVLMHMSARRAYFCSRQRCRYRLGWRARRSRSEFHPWAPASRELRNKPWPNVLALLALPYFGVAAPNGAWLRLTQHDQSAGAC